MEFYHDNYNRDDHTEGFNSQRDGILLFYRPRRGNKRNVSIPNGMEFYLYDWVILHSDVKSFNSQRDGILRTKHIHYVRSANEFQFPTGWNSTIPFAYSSSLSPFQFPTGWNSTAAGIGRRVLFKVSIPNGMEFYFAFSTLNQAKKRFQFPTGWNSTMRRSYHGAKYQVLIPKG